MFKVKKDFIQIDEPFMINKNHVIAIERVLYKEKPDDVGIEKTRLTFTSGKQLIINKLFDETKIMFL